MSALCRIKLSLGEKVIRLSPWYCRNFFLFTFKWLFSQYLLITSEYLFCNLCSEAKIMYVLSSSHQHSVLILKNFVTVRVTEDRNRLPGWVVGSPSLENPRFPWAVCSSAPSPLLWRSFYAHLCRTSYASDCGCFPLSYCHALLKRVWPRPFAWNDPTKPIFLSESLNINYNEIVEKE